jgi:hypothetical protein
MSPFVTGKIYIHNCPGVLSLTTDQVVTFLLRGQKLFPCAIYRYPRGLNMHVSESGTSQHECTMGGAKALNRSK